MRRLRFLVWALLGALVIQVAMEWLKAHWAT
jgi:hypothetical protein